MENSSFGEGWDFYVNNKQKIFQYPSDKNPYKEPSDRSLWMQGWHKAKKAYCEIQIDYEEAMKEIVRKEKVSFPNKSERAKSFSEKKYWDKV